MSPGTAHRYCLELQPGLPWGLPGLSRATRTPLLGPAVCAGLREIALLGLGALSAGVDAYRATR